MNEQVNIRTHDVLIEDEKISHSTGIAKSIFDILLKPQHQDIDPWNAYRPRVFVSAIISLILAIIFFNLLYLMSGFQPSEFHRVVVITALLSLLTIYLYYRFGGDFNIASHLFIFTSTVILGCFIWMTGGFISPILYLLALIPFMALVLGHNKSGYFWVFVSITIYVGFYIIKAKGLASHLTINDKYLDFAQVFGWITLTSCIVMGLVVYRRASENTTKQLHSFGQSLARKAEVDPLSGLLNNVGFDRVLSNSLLNPEIKVVGLILLKIKNLSDIQANLDRVELKDFMQVLAKECNTTAGFRAQIAQLHDDEICFVMTDFYSTSVLDHLARDLFRNFKRGIWVVDKRVNIDIACGIVMAPQHGRTASELLKKADVALSSATEKLPCQIYKG